MTKAGASSDRELSRAGGQAPDAEGWANHSPCSLSWPTYETSAFWAFPTPLLKPCDSICLPSSNACFHQLITVRPRHLGKRKKWQGARPAARRFTLLACAHDEDHHNLVETHKQHEPPAANEAPTTTRPSWIPGLAWWCICLPPSRRRILALDMLPIKVHIRALANITTTTHQTNGR